MESFQAPQLDSQNRLKVDRVGLDAVREHNRAVKDIAFKPSGSTELSQPKYGQEDPDNEEHSGGNKWAGGVSNYLLYITWSWTENTFVIACFRLEDEIPLVSVAGVDICDFTRDMISNR